MSFILRTRSAINGAISGAKSGWILGEEALYRNTYEIRYEQYYKLDEAYQGRIFIDTAKWKAYFIERDLNEKTFPAINPVFRVVDFWEGHAYKGNITEDGRPAPDGAMSAIPLQDATDEVRFALKQIFDWSNWQNQMSICVRYGALFGDVIVEAVDQVEKGKVILQVVEPKYITDVDVNEVGDILSYTKQYVAYDHKEGYRYMYKRVIDLDNISTFKDDQPFSYDGIPAVQPNPYGFVPAIWIKHNDPGVGKFPGTPAVPMGTWRKIEELNSDYTRIRLYIRKLALLPQILAGMGIIDTPETEIDGEELNIEDMMILRASQNGSVYKLEGNLNIIEALKSMQELKAEIEEDLPELTIYSNISQQSQTTGNATSDMLGSVISKIEKVRTNYDNSLSKVFKMALAIAGFRLSEGVEGWAKKSLAQKKFTEFNLESYLEDSIQFLIGKRDTLHRTDLQKAQAETQKWIAVAAALRANIPLKWALKPYGVTDKEIEEIEQEWLKDKRREMDLELEKLQKSGDIQNKLLAENPTTVTTTDSQGRTLSNPKVAAASTDRSLSGQTVNGTGTG